MSGDQRGVGSAEEEAWPEAGRAQGLARGSALKWASGVFSGRDQLERLSQYRKRESQRTASVHCRLKSMVQSYLEGVAWGVEQLGSAREQLREVSQALRRSGQEVDAHAAGLQALDRLREAAARHRHLLAAVSNLPRLYAVRSVVLETERLVESRRLLEAHARLMDLERWQDDILWQLQGGAGPPGGAEPPGAAGGGLSVEDWRLVEQYFSGVGQLVEALGKELWAVVSSALALARQNPTPFVSAVRIVEREEALDRALLEERGGAQRRPLPPGRPRRWRTNFFQVLEEAVSARFRSVSYLHTRGPGLAGHLAALQHAIMADLATVRHLLEHCVPPHYQLTAAYLRASHRCLQAHLAQVISWDLESGEIFAVLNWVLHTYNSADLLGHPELQQVNTEDLVQLVSPEALEQLQSKYVQSVRKSVSEWMHKALQVELQDWQRDQEPDTDHEGFYHTSLPTIITQMLEENARVALMIGPALRDQTIQMGLYEMENLLNRFREALVDFGKEHRRNPSNQNKFYLHYLLASISNCIVLKASTEGLQRQQSSLWASRFSRTPPNPLGALDRAVRRACRLVMEQLLVELQPVLPGLFTRPWLLRGGLRGGPTPTLCRVLEAHLELYGRVRPPCRQRLQEESRWVVVVEVVGALMKRKMVCRSAEERKKLRDQLVQDELLLREVFLCVDSEGLDPLALLPVLADFMGLRDPGLLPLEVSGLAAKYPDISEEQVSVLLDLRGDVTREVRGAVLDLLDQSASPLPAGYRPIFTHILVPAAPMAFCLPSARCARGTATV